MTALPPSPALTRAAGRVVIAAALGPAGRRHCRPAHPPAQRPGTAAHPAAAIERGRFLALDALLGVDELAGFALSNRPRREARGPARVVLVADRFPARDDPLADFALTLAGARVEAASRPRPWGAAPPRD